MVPLFFLLQGGQALAADFELAPLYSPVEAHLRLQLANTTSQVRFTLAIAQLEAWSAVGRDSAYVRKGWVSHLKCCLGASLVTLYHCRLPLPCRWSLQRRLYPSSSKRTHGCGRRCAAFYCGVLSKGIQQGTGSFVFLPKPPLLQPMHYSSESRSSHIPSVLKRVCMRPKAEQVPQQVPACTNLQPHRPLALHLQLSKMEAHLAQAQQLADSGRLASKLLEGQVGAGSSGSSLLAQDANSAVHAEGWDGPAVVRGSVQMPSSPVPHLAAFTKGGMPRPEL